MQNRSAATALAALLLVLSLGACRSGPIVPYAWMPTEEDPRLLIRVPEGTPGSTPVPEEERLHRNAWATKVGEVETPDPRWSCCPDEKEEWKQNEVALFLGYTGVRAKDGVTVGLTYMRFVRHNFGFAVFGEGVFGKEETVPVVGAGIVFKPNNKAGILFAGGAEFGLEEDHHSGEESRQAKALIRFGATYLVAEVGGIRILPAVYVDLIQDRDPVFLFGIEFGREFGKDI